MAESEGLSVSQLMEDLADVTDWHLLGSSLGLKTSQLSEIEIDIPACDGAAKRRKRKVLDTWMKGDPSWRGVASALEGMGEYSIAREMRRKYNVLVPAGKSKFESPDEAIDYEVSALVPKTDSFQVSSVQPQDDDACEIARENECKLQGKFAELEQLVSTELQSMSIDMDKFSCFVKYLFQPADCIPATRSFDEIFLAIGRNKLWDFMNYSHLQTIAQKFGGDNPDIQQAFQEYEEALAGYKLSTKVVHYFATRRNFSEEAYYSNTEQMVARRDQRYFVKLSIKLKARATEKSIQYLTELWEKVSKHLLLPTLPYLLDEIMSGSIVVIWLVPPSIIPTLIIKCMEPSAAEFFAAHNICSLSVGNLVLYEGPAEDSPIEDSSTEQFPDYEKQIQNKFSPEIAKETTEPEQEQQKLSQSQETGLTNLKIESQKMRVEVTEGLTLSSVEENMKQSLEKGEVYLMHCDELQLVLDELQNLQAQIGHLKMNVDHHEDKLPESQNQIQEEARQNIAKLTTEQEQDTLSRELPLYDKDRDGWSQFQEMLSIERKLRKKKEEELGILKSANAYMEVEIGQLREKVTGLEYKLSQSLEEALQLREQLEQKPKEYEISKDFSLEQLPDSQENVEKEASYDVAKETTEQEQDSKEQLQQKTVKLAVKSAPSHEMERPRANMERDLKSKESIVEKPNPRNCKAVGRGLQYGEVNQTAYFQVYLINADGEPCVERQEVNVELKSLVDGSITQAKVSHQKKTVGSYEISYQPSVRGRYELSILVNHVAIKGSPFRVYIQQPLQLMGQPVRIIGGLDRPWRTTLTNSRQLIVTEYDRISVFDDQGELVNRIDSFELEYSGSRVKLHPTGVAIDKTGTMYVCDWYEHKLFKVSSTGRVFKSVGGIGSGPGEFDWLDGITLRDDKIFVCDRNNHRIQIFGSDLNFIDSFGSRGSGEGEFSEPRDIAFDEEGNMYVVESDNHRVQVFSPSGTFLRTFGKRGSGSGELSGPRSLYVDHNIVYITDYSNDRISTFTTLGEFITSLGTKGSEEGLFSQPRGITMDSDGFLYVCDYVNHRIQVF